MGEDKDGYVVGDRVEARERRRRWNGEPDEKLALFAAEEAVCPLSLGEDERLEPGRGRRRSS
jgi:hypothetical protein